MKMPGRCTDQNSCQKAWTNGEDDIWEAMTLDKNNGQAGRGLDMVLKVFRIREAKKMEPKLMNCCMPKPMRTQGCAKMLKRIQTLEDGRVPAKEVKNWRIEAQKKRITRKEYQRLLNKFEMEGFMAQKGL